MTRLLFSDDARLPPGWLHPQPLTGLEVVDLRHNNYFVLLRLPNLTPPANGVTSWLL